MEIETLYGGKVCFAQNVEIRYGRKHLLVHTVEAE